MPRTGIFASLRRRRLALSLAFGYALLLNALVGSLHDARMVAAAENPLLAAIAGSLCGAADAGTPGHPRGDFGDHQQQCPLCGGTCPMGGCAPAVPCGAAPAVVAAPRGTGFLVAVLAPAEGHDSASIYPSDPRSQAPPAAA